MVINDQHLSELIANHTPVEINDEWFMIEPAVQGRCDGCYFRDKLTCPVKAVNICCSNGGNIIIKYDGRQKKD